MHSRLALVAALVLTVGPKAERAALEFEVLAALQLMLGMLLNSVLNDPGPSDPFYGDNPAFHNGVIAPDSLTPADAYPYP